eukprot:m.604326 g.604326  ORF g.604326 m.604326 type:complete len:60 (-) comp22459_c0_seq4:1885-2064(-)
MAYALDGMVTRAKVVNTQSIGSPKFCVSVVVTGVSADLFKKTDYNLECSSEEAFKGGIQ